MREMSLCRRAPLLLALLLGCAPSSSDPPTYEEIDSSIYFAESAGDDPFAEIYEGFRERKAAAREDPNVPPPIEPHETVHRSADRQWLPLDEVIRFDASKARPERVDALRSAVRMARAFDHPDLEILEVVLGPGALLPAHAEGAPGVLLVLDGEADVTVDEESWRVTPGAKVKLEPYAVRRLRASAQGPTKVLWIRWAPRGDVRYITAGYYLTGANQHVQPAQAHIPLDFEFWGAVNDNTPLEPWTLPAADADTYVTQQRAALTAELERLGEDELKLYPEVAVFGHESATPWLDIDAIRNSNFMWAEDILSTGGLLDRWSQVVRMEGLFQARHADGSWDFNISQQAWGSGSRYVEHSHSIPEFYYMLSGRVEHWNGDRRYDAEPGDVFMTNSFQNHESRVRPDGEIWRSYGATWAPNGDRSVFDRPHFLLEELPEQPAGSELPEHVRFH